jgi:CheY-like chemotaxis protein
MVLCGSHMVWCGSRAHPDKARRFASSCLCTSVWKRLSSRKRCRSCRHRAVLLVDDEDAVRHPAADRLRELGYTVLEARDGPEALQILTSTRPDLLVTDVGLPNGMNGRQVAEAVREQLPEMPVLFITGYAGMVLPPGIEVINKPFELDTLAGRVHAILQGDREGEPKN